ncbi:MAG: helix-turn-helix domain-containing protein [Gemmatimonadaceae bacterium]
MVVLRPDTVSGIEVVTGIATGHGVHLDSYAFLSVLSGYLSFQYRRTAHVARTGDLILLEPGRTLVAALPMTRDTLDLLARIACMSKYHLTRLFHGCYGLPPHAYQLQLRLAFAKRLIARGMSVAAAARTAGFAGPVHLHSQFRNRYGVAPGYYAPERRDLRITGQLLEAWGASHCENRPRRRLQPGLPERAHCRGANFR